MHTPISRPGHGRRLVLAVCSLALVAGVIASPASARTLAQARSVCPDGSVCLFADANWNGKYVSFRYGISDFRAFGFSDLASSYVNDGTSTFCVHEHVDFAWPNDLGRSIKVPPWGSDWTLHDGAYFADMASSGHKADWFEARYYCNQQIN